MDRPYFNRLSKDGRLSLLDTKIKRKDVQTATEKLSLFRERAVTITTPNSYDPENMILRLAPELRNKIYTYALDIGTVPASHVRVSSSSQHESMPTSGTNLLQLCKQISIEARSLMETYDVAYVPIMGNMEFETLISNTLRHGDSTLPPVRSTIFTAMTSFHNVHFHLHTGHRPSKDQNDHEPFLDLRTSYLYGRLRQALLIFTCASALIFQRLWEGGVKRKAIVHFDHLFSDWRHMLTMIGCYKFKHLIRIMGEDTNTDWEVRYYVYAGGNQKAQQWREWDERLTKDFDYLKGECSKFPNIQLVAEVYGELVWSLEGKTGDVTRCITPSSKLWPSWPEEVPWRKFERVRSDEAVPP